MNSPRITIEFWMIQIEFFAVMKKIEAVLKLSPNSTNRRLNRETLKLTTDIGQSRIDSNPPPFSHSFSPRIQYEIIKVLQKRYS